MSVVSDVSAENLDMNFTITQNPINNIKHQFFSTIHDDLKDMKFTGIMIENSDCIFTIEHIVLSISDYGPEDLNVTFLEDSSEFLITGKPFNMSGKNIIKGSSENQIYKDSDLYIKINNIEFNMTIGGSKEMKVKEINFSIPENGVILKIVTDTRMSRKLIKKRLREYLRTNTFDEIKPGLHS